MLSHIVDRIATEADEDKLAGLRANASAIGRRIKDSGFECIPTKNWHGYEHRESLDLIPDSVNEILKTQTLSTFGEYWKQFRNLMNSYIHPSNFGTERLYEKVEEGSIMQDYRKVKDPPPWTLAIALASWSLELVAHEMGQQPLIAGMVASAYAEMEHHRDRYAPFFPTTLVLCQEPL
ncbi:MAG: hypothetical protein HONBIEJF_00518 [Fimbriimonadaceae bacterium]|nr:hypothetical protein [Fimbriimonadaceae bacterium]